MANHKSSLKRIRQEEKRRLHNRYYGKTMRNAVRKLRATTDKAAAVSMYPGLVKLLDKLAKTNVILFIDIPKTRMLKSRKGRKNSSPQWHNPKIFTIFAQLLQ